MTPKTLSFGRPPNRTPNPDKLMVLTFDDTVKSHATVASTFLFWHHPHPDAHCKGSREKCKHDQGWLRWLHSDYSPEG